MNRRGALLSCLAILAQTPAVAALQINSAPDFVSKPRGAQRRWRGIVINLDRRPERLQGFVKNMEESHPAFLREFCRFPAVDGSNESSMKAILASGHITEKEFSKAMKMRGIWNPSWPSWFPWKKGGELTPGAVALYETTLQAMRLIADDDTIDFGIVAEDDLAYYSEDFDGSFNRLVNDTEHLWDNTDTVHLQACNQGWKRGFHAGHRPNEVTTIKNVSQQKVPCLGLYAISRSAAKKLSAVPGPLVPMTIQIDKMIPHKLPFLRSLAFRPSIAQTLGSKDPGGGTDVQTAKVVYDGSVPMMPDCTSIRHWGHRAQ